MYFLSRELSKPVTAGDFYYRRISRRATSDSPREQTTRRGGVDRRAGRAVLLLVQLHRVVQV